MTIILYILHFTGVVNVGFGKEWFDPGYYHIFNAFIRFWIYDRLKICTNIGRAIAFSQYASTDKV
ncbi:MAG: hypothetical protein JEZ06_03315 [Anaerolineaceae bacterium]|nr:hypothetical protein [Anaerolineaceae bacterium]